MALWNLTMLNAVAGKLHRRFNGIHGHFSWNVSLLLYTNYQFQKCLRCDVQLCLPPCSSFFSFFHTSIISLILLNKNWMLRRKEIHWNRMDFCLFFVIFERWNFELLFKCVFIECMSISSLISAMNEIIA